MSPTGSYVIKEIDYNDLYVECTDFTDATNAMHHEIAKLIGDAWLTACGIPPVLRRIIHRTCFSPRTVVFNGAGIFQNTGDEYEPGTTLRSVRLTKGIMMGDPLTKVLLHDVNISIRNLGRYISEGRHKELILDNPVIMRSEFRSILPFSVVDDDLPFIETIVDNRPPSIVNNLTPPGFKPKVSMSPPVTLAVKEWLGRVAGKIPNYTAIPGIGLFIRSGDAYIKGYIPKGMRDRSLLMNLRDPNTGRALLQAESDPEDITLQMDGYVAVNPARKKVISSARDYDEARNDFILTEGWRNPLADRKILRLRIDRGVLVEQARRDRKPPTLRTDEFLRSLQRTVVPQSETEVFCPGCVLM
jgi:hypothetical protein